MAKVEYTFDPIGLVGEDPEAFTPEERKAIAAQVSDFVLNSVIEDAGAQVSSVDGSKWAPLSKDYKVKKKALGGKPIANLELTGSYLASMKVIKKRDSTLTLTVSADQMGKADGHNNHSGDSSLPLRRSIPAAGDGETFRDEILRGIEDIVTSAKESSSEQLKSQTEDLQNENEKLIEELGFRTKKARGIAGEDA